MLTIPGSSHNKMVENFTKCAVLHIIACVFDPVRYYSSTVLKAQLFMQELWKEKEDWDTKLDDKKLHIKWLDILENFHSTLYQHTLDSQIKTSVLKPLM